MGADPIRTIALIAVAVCGGLALILSFRRGPRWAMAVWTASLFFTPVWFGVQAGIFFTVLTAITIVGIIAFIDRTFRWSHLDTAVLMFFLALVLGLIIGGALWGHVQGALIGWLLPYVWGRLVLQRVSPEWVAQCIAVAAVLASVLALLEFVTSRNLFLLFPGASSSIWGTLQTRGGELRAEGAFGHSIALGGSLAISSVFVLVVRWPVWVRVAALALVGAATAVTFSRIGIIGLAVTVVLAVLFLGRYLSRAMRVTVAVALVVGAAVALPSLLEVFGEAGSEASGSADYRGSLVPLLDNMNLIGLASSYERLPTGEDYFGGFRSIDSALILIGLRHGLVPLAILIVLLVLAVVALFGRRVNPALVALVGQIPALATVALITQYASFVWFVAGLAVSSYTLYGKAAIGRSVERVEPARELAETA